jgi:hypothetical protein
MKHGRTIIVLAGLIVLGLVVSAAVHLLANTYLDQKKSLSTAATCRGGHQNHLVNIQNDFATPTYTYASRCDTLTITNSDNKLREIGFGEHDQHQAYDGITEKTLEQDQSLTITLRQAGYYKFHDHFQEEVHGKFMVTN